MNICSSEAWKGTTVVGATHLYGPAAGVPPGVLLQVVLMHASTPTPSLPHGNTSSGLPDLFLPSCPCFGILLSPRPRVLQCRFFVYSLPFRYSQLFSFLSTFSALCSVILWSLFLLVSSRSESVHLYFFVSLSNFFFFWVPVWHSFGLCLFLFRLG